MTPPTQSKFITQTETNRVYHCSFCNKRNITLINVGFPISGDNLVCPFCKRMDEEFYDDKKGVYHYEEVLTKQFISKEELCKRDNKIVDEIMDAIIKTFKVKDTIWYGDAMTLKDKIELILEKSLEEKDNEE